jgi:hypothetical protein
MLHTQIYLITIALEIGGCKSEAHSTYIGRDETGRVYRPTQLERKLQLCDGNYSEKLVVGVHPPPSPAWANISIMMECTSESGGLPLCTL